MFDIEKVLTANGKYLDLVKDVAILEDIARIAQKWPEISRLLEDLQTPRTLDEWARLLFEKIDSDEVKGPLEKLKLKTAHERLSTWLNGIPESDRARIVLLLTPLAKLDGVAEDIVELPARLGQELSGGSKVEWHFAFSAQARLALEADSMWPYSGDGLEGSLLAIRAKVAGDAEARAKLPVQFASLAVTAGTAQSIDLAQYFKPASREAPFAAAAAQAIPYLANPLDFDSIWSRLSSPESGLQGITVDYAGEIHLGAQIGLDQSLATDLGSVSAAATLSVAVRRPARMSLSLRRGRTIGNANAVVMTMSRNREVSTTIGLEAGLRVDASQSADKLRALMERGLGKWEAGLEAIKPYLSPGTFIRDKLAAELGDVATTLVGGGNAALRDAIVQDARVALGLDATQVSKLSEWVKSLVVDKIESFAGDSAARAEAAIDKASAAILDDLPSVSLLGPEATDIVREEVGGLIERVKDSFERKVTGLYDSVRDDAAKTIELGDELVRIGELSSNAVESVDDLLEPLRTMIDNFDRSFRSLIETIEKHAGEELTASFEAEDRRVDGSGFEFAGEFTARQPAAAVLYRSLLTGGFQVVEEQVRSSGAIPGFVLDRSRTTISRYSEHGLDLGLKLNILGIGLGVQSSLSSEARATIAGDGTITLDLTGSSGRTITKGKDKRSFSFIGASRIRRLREVAQGQPSRLAERSLSFVMKYDEDKLERGELTAFADALAGASALPGTAGGRSLIGAPGRATLLDSFNGWQPNPGKQASVPASLTVRLALAADKVDARLQATMGLQEDADNFHLAMRQFALAGDITSDDWEKFVEVVQFRDRLHRDSLPVEAPFDDLDFRPMAGVKFKKVHATDRPGPRGTRIRVPEHENVRQTALRAQAFADFARLLNTLYRLPVGPDGFENRREALRLEELLADDVADIVSLGAGRLDRGLDVGRLFAFDPGVTARTIAFLQLIHGHFGIDDPIVTVTMSRADGTAGRVTVT